MPRLVDSFLRTLPVHQSKQVLSLLSKLRDSGTVRTLEEYRSILTSLTESLRSRDISQPSMRVPPLRPGDLISSYTQQKTLRNAAGDITTAFGALESISSLLESQEAIVRADYLEKLKAALDALESAIERFEWHHLNRFEGLNNGLYYKFNTDLLYSPRSIAGLTSSLFRDLRAFRELGVEYDMVPSRLDNKLTLPVQSETEIIPIQVNKLDLSDGSTSDIDISLPGNDISNVLGSTPSLYWTHEVLWDTSSPTGAVLYLEFVFNEYVPINSVAFEFASAAGMFIEQIDAYTYGDIKETVFSDSRFVRENSRVNFSSVTTRRVVVKFRQTAYSKQEYRYNEELGIYSLVSRPLRSTPFDPATSRSDTLSVISSPTARELAGLELTYDPLVVFKYLYQFGFDNIRFYNSIYQDVGIFVSEKITSYGTYAASCSVDEETIAGSTAEVWMLKLNYDAEGNLIDSESFEVPEVDYATELITDEFLVLRSGLGSSRFYPDWDLVSPVVKRNSETLTSGEYSVSIDGGTTWTAGSTPSGTATLPQRYQIRINDYDAASKYTISYRMRLTLSDLVTKIYLNDSLTAYIDPRGLVRFESPRFRSSISYSEIYGVLILRQNNPRDLTVSGGVKSLRLLVGDSGAL